MKNTFLKLSDLSDKKRINYEKKLAEIYTIGLNGFVFKKPFKQFDEYGLKYPTNHLANIGKGIILLPIEYMAKYVDEITFNMLKHEKKNLISADYSFDYDIINTTSIGNFAYVSLNINDEEITKKCNKILHEIFVKFYKEITDFLSKNSEKC